MKRYLSIFLAVLLIFSLVTIFSTSAETEETDTYRYYFYLPEEWVNEYTDTPGIFWWSGTDSCPSWPGYKANRTDIEGLFYYDVPKDVDGIIWNNNYAAPEGHYYQKQTSVLSCNGNESAIINYYPDKAESFDNMIYVIDFNDTITHIGASLVEHRGHWYYYYGNGEYGLTKEKGEEVYTARSYDFGNPAPEKDTNRYYFYMPDDWENELSKDAGIYWWEGTNPCESWPGYKAHKADAEGLFYYDVPKDVTTIIWNNFIDGGTDQNSQVYKLAQKTRNIGSEYYDKNESLLYPMGTTDFDNMVYVVDYDNYDELSWDVSPIVGEWYYYYGNGEYGTTPEKGDIFYTDRYLGTAPEDKVYPSNPKPDVEDMKIYFVDTKGWEEIYIEHHTNYGFGQSNQAPGDLMILEGLDTKGNKIYSFDIPEDTSWIVFSNGTDKSHYIAANLIDCAAFELTEKLDGKYLYETHLFTDKATLLGDTNLDGELNIKDSTLIQKHLANIETLEGLGKPAADFNADGKITIQDATAIQKRIANVA